MTELSDRAKELLADGEWHDGIEFLRELEKVLLPGPAHRVNEEDRARSSRKRHEGGRERVREIDLGRSVDYGKRSILRKLVTDMVRQGTWEVTPYPMPRGQWRQGGWKLRDLRTMRISLSEIQKQHGLVGPMPVLRDLLAQDPPLSFTKAGRVTYVDRTAVPELTDRYKRWRAGQSPRRCSHCKRQLRDYAIWNRLTLCHPQSGMDCYLLVKEQGHGKECRDCMSLARTSTSGG